MDVTHPNPYMMNFNVQDVRVHSKPDFVQKGEPSAQSVVEPDFEDWTHCFKEMIFKPILKHAKSGPFR